MGAREGPIFQLLLVRGFCLCIQVGRGGCVEAFFIFCDRNEQDALSTLNYWQDEVPWQQQEIQIMGRKVLQPRLIAYMADDKSLSYTYSRTQQVALPWTPTVAEIKVRLGAVPSSLSTNVKLDDACQCTCQAVPLECAKN